MAVETEGYETRQTRASFDADARRMSRLAAAGWLVIRVTYTQYMNEWEAVVDRIRRALTRR